MSSFRDLKIWQKGYDLSMKVHLLTRKFPLEEKHGLTDQLNRSANSVIALIAEAHGRFHYADKCRVLYQSRGECTETQSHLSIAHGLGFISREEFVTLDKEYEGLGAGINSYISSLRNA
jgi:four helix bundle protein